MIVLYIHVQQFYVYYTGEFATYLNFCRSLKFEDKPDYAYLRQLFRNLFHKLGYTYDYVFDWNTARIVRKLVGCSMGWMQYGLDVVWVGCSMGWMQCSHQDLQAKRVQIMSHDHAPHLECSNCQYQTLVSCVPLLVRLPKQLGSSSIFTVWSPDTVKLR